MDVTTSYTQSLEGNITSKAPESLRRLPAWGLSNKVVGANTYGHTRKPLGYGGFVPIVTGIYDWVICRVTEKLNHICNWGAFLP